MDEQVNNDADDKTVGMKYSQSQTLIKDRTQQVTVGSKYSQKFGRKVFRLPRRICDEASEEYISKAMEEYCQHIDTPERRGIEAERLLNKCKAHVDFKGVLHLEECFVQDHHYTTFVNSLQHAERAHKVKTIQTNLCGVVCNLEAFLRVCDQLESITLTNFLLEEKATLEFNLTVDRQIRHFSLYKHKLKNDKRLSSLLSGLKWLESVRITDCVLSYGFTTHFNSPRLTSICLSGNSFAGGKKIIGCLESCVNLHHLELDNCQLTDVCAGEMKTLLQKNTKLAVLNIGQNKFGEKAEILLSLAQSPSIKEVHLHQCHLETQCAENLTIFLQSSKTLKIINLNFNKFNPPLPIAIAMAHSSSLESVGLCMSQFNVETTDELITILKGLQNTLVTLDLSRNNLSAAFDSPEDTTVDCPHLEELSLFDCQLTDSQLISKVLAIFPYLNILNLSCNRFSKSEDLFPTLVSAGNTLTEVYLQKCNLSKQCAPGLLIFLRASRLLISLDLGDNFFGGGAEVTQALADSAPDTLRNLYLYRCNLMQASCDSLSAFIASRKLTLQAFDLEGNQLEGCSGIVEELAETTSLIGIDLRSTGLIPTNCLLGNILPLRESPSHLTTIQHVVQIIASNPNLTFFGLSETGWTRQEAESMRTTINEEYEKYTSKKLAATHENIKIE